MRAGWLFMRIATRGKVARMEPARERLHFLICFRGGALWAVLLASWHGVYYPCAVSGRKALDKVRRRVWEREKVRPSGG